MQYKVDFDIQNFEFWAGAKDVFERCVPSDIEINDFVSFDAEDLIFENEE